MLANLGAMLGKLSTISYSRPESHVGLPALAALDKWLTHGLEIRGGRDEKGFLFLYELMRGDLVFKIHSNDSGHALGAILLRMLPPSETQQHGFLMSVLRVMMHNPQLARHLPRFEDDRKVKLSVMFRGQEVFTKLIEKITAVMREQEHAGALCWPQHKFPTFTPSNTLDIHLQLATYLQGGAHRGEPLPTHLRPWLTLRAGRAATKRSLTQVGELAATEVGAFASRPLAPINLDSIVATHTRAQRGLPQLPARLPFDLTRHPAASSELAAAMLSRLEEDLRGYAALENETALPQLVGFSRAELSSCIGSPSASAKLLGRAEALADQLTQLQRRDIGRFATLASQAVAEATGLPASTGAGTAADAERRAAFSLSRLSGREANVTFDHLVTLLLSSRAESDLLLYNPFASARQVAASLELTSLALFTANRVGQAQRCLVEVRELADLVQQLGPATSRRASMMGTEAVERAALSKAEELAKSLTSRRHYLTASATPTDGPITSTGALTQSADFDPRYLVFEFTHDLLLRSAQVRGRGAGAGVSGCRECGAGVRRMTAGRNCVGGWLARNAVGVCACPALPPPPPPPRARATPLKPACAPPRSPGGLRWRSLGASSARTSVATRSATS